MFTNQPNLEDINIINLADLDIININTLNIIHLCDLEKILKLSDFVSIKDLQSSIMKSNTNQEENN